METHSKESYENAEERDTDHTDRLELLVVARLAPSACIVVFEHQRPLRVIYYFILKEWTLHVFTVRNKDRCVIMQYDVR